MHYYYGVFSCLWPQRVRQHHFMLTSWPRRGAEVYPPKLGVYCRCDCPRCHAESLQLAVACSFALAESFLSTCLSCFQELAVATVCDELAGEIFCLEKFFPFCSGTLPFHGPLPQPTCSSRKTRVLPRIYLPSH